MSDQQQAGTQANGTLPRTQALFSGFSGVMGFVSALISGFVSLSFIPFLSARMPSPRPLPSSGSFLGPNTSNAMAKITSRCVGWKRPSSMETSQNRQYPDLLRYWNGLARVNHRPASTSVHYITDKQSVTLPWGRAVCGPYEQGDGPITSVTYPSITPSGYCLGKTRAEAPDCAQGVVGEASVPRPSSVLPVCRPRV